MDTSNVPPDILKDLDAFYESRKHILAVNLRRIRGTNPTEWLAFNTGVSRRLINMMEAEMANPTLHTISLIETFVKKDILIIEKDGDNTKDNSFHP